MALQLLLAALVGGLLLPAQAARVALVIGNASYAERPLKNPTHDAQDLAAALSAAGFRVALKQNLGADAMKEAISEFGDALRREGDTGLFYFSGHGVQTPKGNYLLPVGRTFRRTKDVELFAVEARAVLSEMQQARNPLNILILDACRDSPLPAEERGEGTKGLARMDAPSGSVIAFATAPGKTASDNTAERNGLYTKHLIAAINTPGLRLEDVFKRVGAAVERDSRRSNGDQSPEEVMKLRSEQPFYFRAANAARSSDADEEAWQVVKAANTVAGYDAYLGEYPQGRFAVSARVARALLTPAPATQTPQPTQGVTGSRRAGQVFQDCADCPEMVVIPAGTFTMGSNDGEADERPAHSVSIKSFAMGKFEVTQGQWKAVMGSNPSKFQECGDYCPIEQVSWNDIQQYIQKLSAMTGKQYRLPSEAEWEYAARAGSNGKWSFSSDESQLSEFAWYDANGGNTSHRVGLKKPNAFGLYDVHGNVREWTQDCKNDSYRGAPSDGNAWATSSRCDRVLRGGAWNDSAAFARAAFRLMSFPSFRHGTLGFRLARMQP